MSGMHKESKNFDRDALLRKSQSWVNRLMLLFRRIFLWHFDNANEIAASLKSEDYANRIRELEKDPQKREQFKIALSRMKLAEQALKNEYDRVFSGIAEDIHTIASAYQTGFMREAECVLQRFAYFDSGSFEKNREITKTVQAILRRIGCKVRDPKTGNPANLTYKKMGNSNRFVFEYYSCGKKTGATFSHFPHLQLVPSIDEEPFVEEYLKKQESNVLGINLDVYAA